MSGTTLKLGDGFPKFHPELSTHVKELQALLKKWGYDIIENGRFDWATDSAVLHFQRKMGLAADARVRIGAGTTWKTLHQPLPIVLPGRSFKMDDSYAVPFINQFDQVHVKGAGQTGCFAASETMLRAVGVKQAGPANKYQIVTKETWKSDAPTHTFDATALAQGLAYLKGELSKGRPVMAGVSYSGEADHKGYNESITEHFVVIFDSGESEGTYLFHDPATATKIFGASRTFSMDSARQTLIAEGVPGQEGYAIGSRYFVTMIRKNEE
ncbi:peptidoglycan-binding protein [Sorangium cellulosum]|uniref:Peptidoglycan binding-like domain-containing protein n=1 Tax=Sorangium cellulosum So0157-2 TaxID=1254432 RepID=S4YD58_SORCE|nr:peptidoglycan-binding protein [Sorangium cellulosum]AGP42296.1 hypothetical protein SCE1572_52040 [Sorangium cellulosum So0157-2]